MGHGKTLVGYKRLEGKSKKTGKDYKAWLFFLQFESQDVYGYETEDIYIDDTKLNFTPEVGMTLDIRYNKNGYLEDIYPIDEKVSK